MPGAVLGGGLITDNNVFISYPEAVLLSSEEKEVLSI